MFTTHFISIPKNLSGRTIFVRVDFNEPLKNKKIADSFRIERTLPTLKELRMRGARLVLGAHLEDSKKTPLSFTHVRGEFERCIGEPLPLVKKYSPDAVQAAFHSTDNNLVLLENLRINSGEVANDFSFASMLATCADMYVNEAFSVSHRKHASIVGIPQLLPSYAGFLFEREVDALSEALNPPHPFLLIVGGVKFETKFALLKNFLPIADAIFVGGALANTFLKAHGVEIGQSVHDATAVASIQAELLTSKKIFFPLDARIDSTGTSKDIYSIGKQEGIYDIGKATVAGLGDLAKLTKLIVWNGPLGYLEKGYIQGTKDLLRLFAKLKVKVILGGGDTLEVLDELKMHHKFYHVSTGGGAMLDFLADGTLPGIDALMSSQKSLSRNT